MDTKLLESLGLTHNEAIAYVTLSKIGLSKTGRLLKESGLNTGKVYEILDSLKRKGLVSETEIDNVKHFAAAPPDRLIEYISTKKDQLKKEEEIAKSLIPEIEKIRESKLDTSRIVVYTGFNGFKSAVNEATKTLKPKEEILAMGVRASKGEEFNRVWTQWAEQTLPKNHERVIFSDKGAFYDYKLKSKYSQVRFLEIATPNAITIFGDHTLIILQYKDPVRVIFINDSITATTFISIFEQLWNVAKKMTGK